MFIKAEVAQTGVPLALRVYESRVLAVSSKRGLLPDSVFAGNEPGGAG